MGYDNDERTKLGQQLGRTADRIDRFITLFIFEDVIYAVLPLLVLALITALLRKGYDHFLLLKEWSFASVVIVGVAIKRGVKLKTAQRDTESHRFTGAVQLPILLLIVSVLVLALVTLHESGNLPAGHGDALVIAQLVVFVAAHLLLAVIIAAEIKTADAKDDLPATMSQDWLLTEIREELERCDQHFLRVDRQVDRLTKLRGTERADAGRSRYALDAIATAAGHTERIATELAARLKMLREQDETA